MRNIRNYIDTMRVNQLYLSTLLVLFASLSQAFDADSTNDLNFRLLEQLESTMAETPLIAKVMPYWTDEMIATQEQQSLAYQQLLGSAIANDERMIKRAMLRHTYWRDINVLRLRALAGEDFAVGRIVLRTEADMLEVIDLLRSQQD